MGEFLVGTNSVYGCGKGDHMLKDCPNVKTHEKVIANLNQAVLALKFQKGTICMHSRLGVNKRALPML